MSAGGGTGPAGVRSRDLYAGAAFMLVGAGALSVGEDWGERSWVFPNVLSVGLLVVGAVLVVKALVVRRRERLWSSRQALLDAAWFSAGMVVYVAVLGGLGYALATLLFVWALSVALSGRPSVRGVLLRLAASAAGTAALYALFGVLLDVPLP